MFAGTRVPVQTLLDYLEGGESIDDFLEGFPTVTREQVVAFLEEAGARMKADHEMSMDRIRGLDKRNVYLCGDESKVE